MVGRDKIGAAWRAEHKCTEAGLQPRVIRGPYGVHAGSDVTARRRATLPRPASATEDAPSPPRGGATRWRPTGPVKVSFARPVITPKLRFRDHALPRTRCTLPACHGPARRAGPAPGDRTRREAAPGARLAPPRPAPAASGCPSRASCNARHSLRRAVRRRQELACRSLWPWRAHMYTSTHAHEHTCTRAHMHTSTRGTCTRTCTRTCTHAHAHLATLPLCHLLLRHAPRCHTPRRARNVHSQCATRPVVPNTRRL